MAAASKTQYRMSRGKRFIKNNLNGWLTALPLVIGIGVFTVYPMVMSLIYSFHKVDLYEMSFVGFAYFKQMFGIDSVEFFKSLSNTFIYAAIAVPMNLVLSYFLAVLVNQKVKGVLIYRLCYYLPVVIPGVVSGVIWKDMFDPSQSGFFNTLLANVGLGPYQFFASPNFGAMATVFFMALWSLGSGMILWLAALKNIPTGLYEAAKIDGAGAFRRFISVTVPLSTPMIFYNLVTGLIGALQINATMVYAPRGGQGENYALYFFAVKIYTEAFRNNSYGYAAALSWVLFIIIALLTAVTFKTNKWMYTGD